MNGIEPPAGDGNDAESRQKALFPRWVNSTTRVGLWTVLGLGIGSVCFLMAWVRSPLQTLQFQRVDQPVLFDHRHHVRDDGIDCRYCHYDSERTQHAGVPETELCMGCHAQVWSTSPLLEPVRKSLAKKEPIHWRRVTLLPDFVYFNHRIHVHKGIGCETCHGRVDLMANVFAVTAMHMNFCLNCHRQPEKFLRPPELVTAMGYAPNEPQAVLGARLRDQLSVKPPVHCSACHR